jgi:hypothetical protein
MASTLETTVITIITVVIFYLLIALILKYTWNQSVTKMFSVAPVDIWESLFLIVTANILFGTFQQSAVVVYNSYVNEVASKL